MQGDTCPPIYDEGRGGADEAIYVQMIPNKQHSTAYDTDFALTSDVYELFSLLHSKLEANLCLDENRISVEGELADMWGCYFAGDGQRPASDPSKPRLFLPGVHVRVRLHDSVSGLQPPPDQPPCNGPVATLLVETPVPGQADTLRAHTLAMNGCSPAPLVPWHTDLTSKVSCFAYMSCRPGYPVVWCSRRFAFPPKRSASS